MVRAQLITPGLYWIPGQMPADPLREPDIANAFIFERGEEAYLIDSGVGGPFREALRAFFHGKSYETFTLINTHWHVDHVCNNDLLNRVDARVKRHVIREDGAPFLDMQVGMLHQMKETARYFSPLRAEGTPLHFLAALMRPIERVAPRIAYGMAARVMLRKFGPIRSLTGHLSPLREADRKTWTIGNQQLTGWEMGELLILDDRGHSPDSVTIYEPVRRVLLLGDLSYEYNPLWVTGTYGRTIQNLQVYRNLAADGYVRILGDSHHHRLFVDQEEILSLLDELLVTHRRRRQVIERAWSALGARTVEELRQHILQKDPEFARMAQQEFPKRYCSTRAMIAVALRELAESKRLEVE